MLRGGQDVELLPTVRAMAMPDDAELFEDVERPIDRGRDGVGVAHATALDELRAGDVAVDLGKDLDQDPALRCPAQSAGAQLARDRRPRSGELGRCRRRE